MFPQLTISCVVVNDQNYPFIKNILLLTYKLDNLWLLNFIKSDSGIEMIWRSLKKWAGVRTFISLRSDDKGNQRRELKISFISAVKVPNSSSVILKFLFYWCFFQWRNTIGILIMSLFKLIFLKFFFIAEQRIEITNIFNLPKFSQESFIFSFRVSRPHYY